MARNNDSHEAPQVDAGPLPSMSKLASLLQQGMITRDEFDHLKAKLIAMP